MKRITVQQIKEAYVTTGFEPVRKTSMFLGLANDKKGCPIDVLIVGEFDAIRPELISQRRVARALDLPEEYISGFIDGIDGTSTCEVDERMPNEKLGYEDGCAVASAIFGVST